ncbi:DUF305 domain-containing protein [soil metagenome]
MNNETNAKDDAKINHEIGTKDEITKQDETGNKMENDKHQMMSGSYARFGAMVGTSTAVMFGLMYLNTYALDHIFFSETRFYMMFVMGAVMAVIMLLFMLNMYKNSKVNIGIFAGSVVIFLLALWLVRSQTTVEDVSYMRAMIPHHSIAILTSERANITDPRVRKLADEIIEAQRREIDEMKFLIQDIESKK